MFFGVFRLANITSELRLTVAKRLVEHNSKNGRWTSSYKPWDLIAAEEFPDRAAAARRERFLKSRAGIEARKELAGKHGEGKI